MAIEAALEGLFVGEDKTITMVVYQSDGTTAQNITGWTIVLDIRKKDTTGTALLSKTATLVTPASGICSFALSDDDLAASVFPGDDWTGRYSIKRTDTGVETILRYGDVTITRVTQA